MKLNLGKLALSVSGLDTYDQLKDFLLADRGQILVMPMRKVLVVEDDPMVGLYLEDLLDGWGCEVIGPVTSASEAEALAAAGQFKFALLDVNLIGGTSFGAAEILSSRHVPFAFVTAYGPSSVRQDLGAAAILSKPIVVRELKRVLGEAGLF